MTWSKNNNLRMFTLWDCVEMIDTAAVGGLQPVDLNALSSLNESIVYVKADARATFQSLLTVLEAFAWTTSRSTHRTNVQDPKDTIMPPYGLSLKMGAQ